MNQSLFSNIDLSRFTVAPTSKTEYTDLIEWIGNTAYQGIAKKRRWIAVHKKLEGVPLVELKRWKAIAEKSANPGLTFNVYFKRWRAIKERVADEKYQ